MKLIAHRGGSFGKENSLITIIEAAKMGADAVECDIRKTKDGVYVIFHDEGLTRLGGVAHKVSQITYKEMQECLAKNNQSVLTFDELANGYKESNPILLHIKLTDYDEAFAKYVVDSKLPLIVGVMSLDMLSCFSKLLPPDRILAFLPTPDKAKEFYENGAGIIRLWEQWLGKVTPQEIKSLCPNAQVFIMLCNLSENSDAEISLETMDGSIESIKKCQKLGADGVLLNNIEMALKFYNLL